MKGWHRAGVAERTFFSDGTRRENFPNRTWKGEHAKSPFSCSTTITSIAPDKVACKSVWSGPLGGGTGLIACHVEVTVVSSEDGREVYQRKKPVRRLSLEEGAVVVVVVAFWPKFSEEQLDFAMITGYRALRSTS